MKKLLLFASSILIGTAALAQCAAGEVEVTIDVHTDAYGYETYWELLPSGNACGNGAIFTGGNPAVGCNGGGAQNQTPGGYGNNLTITEGPWCMTQGSFFDIVWVDDWGDDGLDFTVYIDGLAAHFFEGSGAGNTFTFEASPPPPNEAAADEIFTAGYVPQGNVDIDFSILNLGSNNITSIDFEYTVDGGTAVSGTVNGLNIAPFETGVAVHPTPWNATTNGSYQVVCTITGTNGGADHEPLNNSVGKTIIVGPGTPNIIDGYLSLSPIQQTVIANSSDQVDVPRDLDFHPVLGERQLWVINKDTENSGGSTVIIDDAGEGNQSSQWKRDGNAWHFMSLPTGIAFSTDNFNFGTTTGVWDANHQAGPTGQPFTGPSLWDSDLSVYAEPSGGNGSHIDMLHESPYCQGIAWERQNAFWIFDGHSNDIVMYDFNEDHGPGNDDHSDGEILRYIDVPVAKDPNNHIVSHLAFDDDKKWLYVVDHGNDRVFRMDITTGTVGGTPTYPQMEPLAQYENVTGYTWEEVVTTGLVEPSGIAVIEDRMLVSDHSNGDIIVYDITSMPAVELGRIATDPGIMGIEIGPDGHIWYVNATTSEVVRLDAAGLSVDEYELSNDLSIFPNPAQNYISLSSKGVNLSGAYVELLDATGKRVRTLPNYQRRTIDVNDLAAGTYFVRVISQDGLQLSERVIIR